MRDWISNWSKILWNCANSSNEFSDSAWTLRNGSKFKSKLTWTRLHLREAVTVNLIPKPATSGEGEQIAKAAKAEFLKESKCITMNLVLPIQCKQDFPFLLRALHLWDKRWHLRWNHKFHHLCSAKNTFDLLLPLKVVRIIKLNKNYLFEGFGCCNSYALEGVGEDVAEDMAMDQEAVDTILELKICLLYHIMWWECTFI